MTVLDCLLTTIIVIVTFLTEVGCAKAVEEGHTTAELAFPVDLSNTVLLARGLSSSNSLEHAGLAEQVFLLSFLLFRVVHLLLTVDQTSEVRLLALVALIERASMISELLGLSEIGISRSDDSFISKDSLLISILESLLLNILLQCKERAKLLFDCIGDSVHFDLLLATRARHEGKGDSK